MKAENIIGGPNSAANPPIEGAPPSEPSKGSIGEALGHLARTGALLHALEAMFEQLEDQFASPDSFPIVTAAEACVECAHTSLREARQAAEGTQAALRNANAFAASFQSTADRLAPRRSPPEGHEVDPELVEKAAMKPSVIRLLALVDMASSLSMDDPDPPGLGEATDDADKMTALMNAMRFELEALHAEVSHDHE